MKRSTSISLIESLEELERTKLKLSQSQALDLGALIRVIRSYQFLHLAQADFVFIRSNILSLIDRHADLEIGSCWVEWQMFFAGDVDQAENARRAWARYLPSIKKVNDAVLSNASDFLRLIDLEMADQFRRELYARYQDKADAQAQFAAYLVDATDVILDRASEAVELFSRIDPKLFDEWDVFYLIKACRAALISSTIDKAHDWFHLLDKKVKDGEIQGHFRVEASGLLAAYFVASDDEISFEPLIRVLENMPILSLADYLLFDRFLLPALIHSGRADRAKRYVSSRFAQTLDPSEFKQKYEQLLSGVSRDAN